MARARTLTLKTQVEVTGADKLDNLGKKMQKVGGVLTATVTAPLALLGGVAANAASDLNESLNAINVSFGETADEINKIGEASADSFGLSQRAFNEVAVRFSSFASTVAGEGGNVAGVIEELTQRGADFASVYNLEVADALGLFQSGLAGETEPLRRFGIDLSAAAVEAHALATGIHDGQGAMTEAEKVQARYSLLMQQTAKVQGDFANTSGEVANQQRILAAETEDAAAALGQKFLPIQQKLIEFASGLLDAWSKLPAPMQDVVVIFGAMAAAAGPLLLVFGSLIRSIKLLNIAVGKIPPGGILARLFPLGAVALFAEPVDQALQDIRASIRDFLNLPEIDFEAPDWMRFELDPFSEFFLQVRPAAEDAADALNDFEDPAIRWAENWASIQDATTGAADGIRAGASDIDAAAQDMADGLPEAMEEAKEAAEQIAKQTPGSLAGELRENIDDYGKALDELADVAANSVSDLAERQEIEGVLASKKLTDALNSDSTRTRLLAQELVNDLVSDYELLEPGALSAGSLVNPALRQGVLSNINLAAEAGGAVVDAAGRQLVELPAYGYGSGRELIKQLVFGINDNLWRLQSAAYNAANQWTSVFPSSEPKDPNSPFRGITTAWGFMDTLAKGLTHHSDAPAKALRSVLGVDLGQPAVSLSTAPASSTGGVTIINNYYLQWDGEPPRGRDEDEIISNLQRLSPLVDGGVRYG